MIVFTYCCRKWYWYSILYTNVEHSICKCPTGYFLNHLPTEITLQIFIGMTSFFFQAQKAWKIRPVICSKMPFGFSFTETNCDMKIRGDKHIPLCSSFSCSLQAQRMEQRLGNYCLFHISQAERCEDFVSYSNVSANREWIQI